MSWVLDAEIHLDAMRLGDAIKDKNKAFTEDCAKALIFLRHHLDEELKIEYLTVKDPLVLWNGLKERYDNLKLQYIEKGFKKYSELISLLLVAERNNDLFMRNHDNRSTRSTPLPEVDEVYSHYVKRENGRGPVHGQGRNFSGVNHPQRKITTKSGKEKNEKPKERGLETECYRCGGKGHWANICRTPKYLVEL
ncbi:uncharacterized protein [Nicotiana tomentosiformis]|uniref:uncharacterized protein n=1 Tax=Nicotiana tomentosiformis TaxID=4098 RepID=UPI00388CE916